MQYFGHLKRIISADAKNIKRRNKMKKLLAIILTLAMILSLAACGETAPTPGPDSSETTAAPDGEESVTPEEDSAEQESALETLTRIWDAYPADEEGNKFMTFGGDYHEENQVENAPGWHSIDTAEDAESLDTNFGLPASMVSSVSRVACIRHMLNANTFTCSAYEVIQPENADVDNVQAVADALRDGLMNRAYMCGWPEQLEVYSVEKSTVVCFFGALDIVNAFKDALVSVYGDDCAQLYEEDMSEAGGDNTFGFPVPELG